MFETRNTLEIGEAHFSLRGMDGIETLEVYQQFKDGAFPPATMLKMLTWCLEDWEGATTVRGGDLGEFDEKKIRWLAGDVIDRLCAEVINLSSPEDEEKKPSEDSPSSSSTPASSTAPNAGA